MLTSSPYVVLQVQAHSQEAERELSQQSLEKIHHDPRMLCLLLTCFNVVRLPMVGELVCVFPWLVNLYMSFWTCVFLDVTWLKICTGVFYFRLTFCQIIALDLDFSMKLCYHDWDCVMILLYMFIAICFVVSYKRCIKVMTKFLTVATHNQLLLTANDILVFALHSIENWGQRW